ncbi:MULTISPECIES: Cof-type HAD-IIB family hydrolase [Paenibacillus]|uniref:Cof-type HAD-IIB family hydrolase n=1 Tax=Paenibacillus TaxID=44249 RepID=UPI0022B86F64|nr:Cof-type HAD-IIB family hydrolase [Paenibacillus caseinilyticus]MCZ8518003.1 Cof-type HAD-IIB family hydrolase [Paenibacillus caseinilyticus]
MSYRLIALDVDGTLLNDKDELTERTALTVREAYEAGARIVLCTGRGPGNAVPVLDELGLQGVLITHNGAATVESPGPKLLHEFSYGVGQIEELIRFCRERGIHYDVCTALDMFVDRLGDAVSEMYDKFGVTVERVEDVLALTAPIVKCTLFGSGDELDAAEAELSKMGLPPGIQSIRSGIHFLDIMLDSVSKGSALRYLAELWEIPSSEVLAIGNYYNDIDMIRFAGLGIAMENSPEAVKAAADTVTLSNNEEGVHEAIQRHVLASAAGTAARKE